MQVKKKVIVFSDNKSTYKATNKEQKEVCEITIDGALITDGARCDYGLWVEDNRLFLIELKGHDIEHACFQLLETYKYFMTHYKMERFSYKFRVIAARVRATAPNLQTNKHKLERMAGCKVKIKTKLLEEHI